MFSTIAESNMPLWGCSVVGMTNMTERDWLAKQRFPLLRWPWPLTMTAGDQVTCRHREFVVKTAMANVAKAKKIVEPAIPLIAAAAGDTPRAKALGGGERS